MKRLLLLLTLACAGCASGNVAAHRALNTATDVVDPSWELAIAVCESVSMLAVERGTDAADVRARLTRINGRCDAAFAQFQALRQLQVTGRAAADAGDRSGALRVAAEIVALHRDIRELIAAIRQEVRR